MTGYDYCRKLVELGKSYGLDLFEGSVAELDMTDHKYDVIILNHVIEHFTDSFGNMKSILKHLNHNGILYAGVPNIDNFDKNQFQNAHVYYFSPRTFDYYIRMCSLEKIQFASAEKVHMYGIYKIAQGGSTQKDLLNAEYTHMKRVITRRKLRSIIVSSLEKIRMKKALKSLIVTLSKGIRNKH